MKKATRSVLLLFIVVVVMTVISTSAFGYGQPKSDYVTQYFTWIVWDDIPRWVGAYCTSNFTQYAMIIEPYIGFHEAHLFACADPTSPFDTYYVWGGYSVQYYKGSTNLGSTSLSYSSEPVIVDPDWVWFNKEGNANGLLGEGSGTYYAKTYSAFSVEGAIETKIINNSVSFSVN